MCENMQKRIFKNRKCPDCGGIMRDEQPPYLCENCGEWKLRGAYWYRCIKYPKHYCSKQFDDCINCTRG